MGLHFVHFVDSQCVCDVQDEDLPKSHKKGIEKMAVKIHVQNESLKLPRWTMDEQVVQAGRCMH